MTFRELKEKLETFSETQLDDEIWICEDSDDSFGRKVLGLSFNSLLNTIEPRYILTLKD